MFLSYTKSNSPGPVALIHYQSISGRQVARMSTKVLFSLLILSLVSTGCVYQKIKPWERDVLAQDKMKLVPHPVESALDEHIYFSKEAASGGQGVGGGGCGCN